MSTEPLATVTPSAPRRVMGVGMLMALGVLLLYLATQSGQGILGTAFLIAVGFCAMLLSLRMWQSTKASVVLTTEGMFTDDGKLIAAIEDIEKVERGFLALKPSNGFTLRTKTSAARSWAPGLWWRLGKTVGVGGVTPGRQTKIMSEAIATMLIDKTLVEQIVDEAIASEKKSKDEKDS